MIITFTGHRAQALGGFITPNPIYNYVKSELVRILTELKPELTYCGMAQGYDSWAAEVCIDLGIPFIAAVPFAGQESIWPPKAQDKYNELLQQAKDVVIVSSGAYSASKMQIRNCYMVDRADKIVACWNGLNSGGTFNCLTYAKKLNKEITIIDPRKANG